jgi:hypothetical protein
VVGAVLTVLARSLLVALLLAGVDLLRGDGGAVGVHL